MRSNNVDIFKHYSKIKVILSTEHNYFKLTNYCSSKKHFSTINSIIHVTCTIFSCWVGVIDNYI